MDREVIEQKLESLRRSDELIGGRESGRHSGASWNPGCYVKSRANSCVSWMPACAGMTPKLLWRDDPLLFYAIVEITHGS